MSISILNRGASGGMKPELTVTAPEGSTIDLLQSGIIVATYTLGSAETEHTFIVKVGTYTVRGTLGTNAQSKDVLIEVAGRYSVKISYFDGVLYNNGDQRTAATGGWTATWTDSSATMYQFTRNSTNMSWSSSGKSRQIRYTGTANEIDLTDFTRIEANYSFYTAKNQYGSDIDNWDMRIMFRNASGDYNIKIWGNDQGTTTISGTKVYDLPNEVLNDPTKKFQVFFWNRWAWNDTCSGNCTVYSARLLP